MNLRSIFAAIPAGAMLFSVRACLILREFDPSPTVLPCVATDGRVRTASKAASQSTIQSVSQAERDPKRQLRSGLE